MRVETDPLIAKEGFSATRTSNALTPHRCATDLPETRRPANVLAVERSKVETDAALIVLIGLERRLAIS